MANEEEQEWLDIDWFFTNNEEVAFVASGGGKLPMSADNSGVLLSYFMSLPDRCGIIINTELHKIISPVNERYLSDFVSMSKKGLFSFDKTLLNGFLDTHYHLVTQPQKPLNLNELPSDISDLLRQTYYSGKMLPSLDISNIK